MSRQIKTWRTCNEQVKLLRLKFRHEARLKQLQPGTYEYTREANTIGRINQRLWRLDNEDPERPEPIWRQKDRRSEDDA
ncbi:MAG: hypothetical protein IJ210_15165 [Clostridia bacterium]|nr:hypothetical protein [Clostridia bacterium]